MSRFERQLDTVNNPSSALLSCRFGTDAMALKLGTGSEAYAPLRAIIGGLIVSVVLSVFIVLAAYVLVYGRDRIPDGAAPRPEVA